MTPDIGGVRDGMDLSLATLFERAKREESAYVTGNEVTNDGVAADGGTSTMHLRNPAGSGKTLQVITFLPSAAFSGWFRVYDKFNTAPSGGTAATIDNLLMDEGGDDDPGIAEANSGVSFDAGSPHMSVVLPSGGTPSNQIGGVAPGDRAADRAGARDSDGGREHVVVSGQRRPGRHVRRARRGAHRMTYEDSVVDSYVVGDRRMVLVDLNITSLDEQGFENWDPSQYAPGQVRGCWAVGRESGIRDIIQWDSTDEERLAVTKPNGTKTGAGSDLGSIRMRIEMDR